MGVGSACFFSPLGVHQLPPSSFSSYHDGNLPPVTLPLLLSFLSFRWRSNKLSLAVNGEAGDRKGEEEKPEL